MHSKEVVPDAVLQAWGLGVAATRGPRPRFTLAEVVQAACDQADDDGIDSVTLAAVAARLQVTTTGLYRYVDSKDTLVELVIDAALGPAPELSPGTSERRVIEWVDALWDRYLAHPWMANYPLERAPRCPQAFAWLDVLVRALADAGDDQPLSTAMVIDVLVRGFAAVEGATAASSLSPAIAAEVAARHPAITTESLEPAQIQLRSALHRLLNGR